MRLIVYILILSTLGIINISSQNDETPYIYYHSEALNGIVVERADGSDSRIIARNLMPVNHEYVSVIGWSPSGEWLAWTSTYRTAYSIGPKRIWVMSTDGEQRLTFLDNIDNVIHASWSPTGDYLLIMEQYWDGLAPIWLIDVEQQHIVANFDDIFAEVGVWSADGNSVQLNHLGVQIVYTDGRIENDVPPELRPPLATAQPEQYPADMISPTGNHELIVNDIDLPNQIVDFETDQIALLRPHSGDAGGICDFDWHPESEWLLVTFTMTWAGGGCPIAGSSVISSDGRIQRELGPCNIASRCAGWLSEHVIEHLALGQPNSIVPDPILTIEHDGWIRGVQWHPDGIQLATYSEGRNDDGYYVYDLSIWDTTTLEMTQTYRVEICADSLYIDCDIRWNSAGTQIGLTGHDGTQIVDLINGEIILVSDDYLLGFDTNNSPILFPIPNGGVSYDPTYGLIAQHDWRREVVEIYSLESDSVLYQLELEAEINAFTLVPGGNYVAFVGYSDEPVQGDFLWDLSTGEVDILPKYAFEFLTNIVAFDSNIVIGYGRASLLYFWDVETRTVAARLNRYVMSVDVTPDLTRMATGSGYMIEVWNYQTIIDQISGE